MIAKYLTPGYLAAAVAGLLVFRHFTEKAHSGVTRTEEAQGAHETGSDFMPELWSVINGGGQGSFNFPNLLPGANADPGGNAAANLGLMPKWDGSIQ